MSFVEGSKYANKLKINGIVGKCDPTLMYIPGALFGFELEQPIFKENNVYKNMETKSGEEINSFRTIVLDDEEVDRVIEEGDYIEIVGEVQSRNFDKFHPIVEPELQNAVELYYSAFDKYPTKKQPTERFDQDIVWKKILDLDFINKIPIDAIFNEKQEKVQTERNFYHYKVDWNGEVKRITRETIYEVLVHEYKLLDHPPEKYYNEVMLKGRIASDITFDIGENGEPYSFFTLHTYLNYFRGIEKRFAFLPIEVYGDEAIEVFDQFKKGSFIELDGRFLSKDVFKVLRNRRVTASGKIRRRKAEFYERGHYIHPFDIKEQES